MAFLKTRSPVPPVSILLVLAAVLDLGAARAESQSWAGLADGKPWAMQTADGKSGEITFLSDGTGKMKGGPMGFKLKWRAEGKLFCMKPGPMTERCLDMRRVDGGFDGYRNGKRQVVLRR